MLATRNDRLIDYVNSLHHVKQLVMAVSLAGAYVLLRREQQKHMSSFDLRKDPRQRGSLLGSAGAGGQKGAD